MGTLGQPRLLATLAIFLGVLILAPPSSLDAQTADDSLERASQVHVIEVEGIINQIVANFILTQISEAERASAEAIVIQMDTPGGLDVSMREIVKRILNAKVPVVVYISPAGARAASAGVFLTYASHVAAMAPGTNIGAAHPVNLGGDLGEEQEKKVVNDAAAYLRAIAKERGRNEQWAEEAVRNSLSLTAEEAVDQGVVDFVAPSLPSLLDQMDKWQVETAAGEITLSTREAPVDQREMTFRQRFFHTLTDPNIAYLLLMLGSYGILYELANPGFGFAGIGGAISVILGLYALHVVGINYAGLALILLAFGLFIADIFTPTHGVLTGGGIISLLIGSLILIDAPRDQLAVSLTVIIPTIMVTALFFAFAVSAGIRAQRSKVASGVEGMVGEIGQAESVLASEGEVLVKGEHWRARSVSGRIKKGEKVRVIGMEGLRLKVTRLE